MFKVLVLLFVIQLFSRNDIFRLCFSCFISDYLVKMRKPSYKCRKYNSKHHVSTCTFETRDNSARTESQNDSEETITSSLNNKDTVFCKLHRFLFQI